MSFLLYCIFPRFDLTDDFVVIGVGNHPVEVLTWENLGIAVSPIELHEVTPDIARVTAYEKVVETFFAHRPVLPLRYGNIVEHKEDALAFLNRGHIKYERILDELTGCVEMGIRILLPVRRPPAEADSETMKGAHGEDNRRTKAGASYLHSRRVHYEMEDIQREEIKDTVGRFLSIFSGLFKKSKVEDPQMSALSWLTMHTPFPILSLYFLVPEEFLEKFQETFRGLEARESEKILLSGPWPPYNFAEVV